MGGERYEGLPASIREVLTESDQLRSRLVRVARALEVGSHVAAERLVASPSRGGPDENMLVLARRSQEISELCHDLVARLSRP